MESESAELQNMRRVKEHPEPEAEERDRDLVCTGSDRPFRFSGDTGQASNIG